MELDLTITDLVRDLMWTTLLLAGPALIVALVIGLLVSIFQALTSVQEQTMALVPKVLAVMLVVLLLLAPAMTILKDYTQRVLGQLVEFGLS